MFFIKLCFLLTLVLQTGYSEQPTYITFPTDISWKSKESEHFTAVFRDGREDLAVKVLNAAEKAHNTLTPIFPEGPGHTWILIADFRDSLNGYALNFPYSHIVFYAAPPNPGGQLGNSDEWIYSVILHEYVHILHIYPASGIWKLLRTVFGTWVVPNGMMPSHLHEGLATFLETQETQGGRGRGTVFSMYQRMAVEEKVWGNSFAPLDLMDGSATRWPYGTSPYFFGSKLYEELWNKKGKQGIYDLTSAYSSNWPYFINTPLEDNYQFDYPTLWSNLFEKEKQKSEAEIAQIKKETLSKLNYLTQSRSFKGGLTLSPDKTQVALVVETPREIAHIRTWDIATHKSEILVDIGDSAFSDLCWIKGQTSEKILYITSSNKNAYVVNELFSIDLKTKKTILLKNGEESLTHVHRIACSPTENKLLIYTDKSDRGEILELNYTWDTLDTHGVLKLVRKWPVPERQWVTSLLPGKVSWFGVKEQLVTHLYKWEQDKNPVKVGTLPKEVFRFKESSSPDSLEAISDVSGRYELWDIHPTKNTLTKKVSLLGGINSFEKIDNQYLVSSYHHGGYDLAWAETTASHSIPFPNPQPHSPIPETTKSLKNTEDYSPISTLRPYTWVPSLLFVPDGAQIGAWIPGFDLTQKHLFDIFAGYDTRGLPFGSALYTYRFGKSSSLFSGLNFSPSYLKESASFYKSWGGSVGYGEQLPWGLPQASLSFVFNRLEASSLSSAEQSVGVRLGLKKSWGFPAKKLSISPVNGIQASLTHTQYFKALGSDRNFFTSIATLSSYLEAPWWRDSVFYLGNQLGYTEGSTFINSFFQGGGEILFSQGRGIFLNRGFLPFLFAGRRMFSTNLEYRFPIKRIERGLQLLPAFLHSIHGALVVDTISYDRGVSSSFPKNLMKKFYTSCGVELKSDWKFIYYLPTQVRLGAYHGFGPYGENLYFTLGVEAGL